MSAKEMKKKRSKKYYTQPSKRRKRCFVLQPGMKGFIVTCNNRERDCIREAYDLLNEFADILYGPEQKEEIGDDIDDVDAALKNEINSMKNVTEKRFQVVESNANNCLFIKTLLDDPNNLVYAILDDIEKNKTQRTKYLLRMMPVMNTCKAYIDDIKKCLDKMATAFFSESADAYPTYAITYKIRNNNRIKREDLLLPLVELIQSKQLKTTPDLKNPSVVINVEIVCTMCCLSIVKDYYRYRKYNLIEYAAKVKGLQEDGEKVVEEKNGGGDVLTVKIENDVENNTVLKSDDQESGVEVTETKKIGRNAELVTEEIDVPAVKNDGEEIKTEINDVEENKIE